MHRRLFNSHFLCPACLGVKIFDWQSYLHHWEETHQRAAALMVVHDESNVGPRTSSCLALAAVMRTVEFLKLDNYDWQAHLEPEHNVTMFGGSHKEEASAVAAR
jgi:hypothetical protein